MTDSLLTLVSYLAVASTRLGEASANSINVAVCTTSKQPSAFQSLKMRNFLTAQTSDFVSQQILVASFGCCSSVSECSKGKAVPSRQGGQLLSTVTSPAEAVASPARNQSHRTPGEADGADKGGWVQPRGQTTKQICSDRVGPKSSSEVELGSGSGLDTVTRISDCQASPQW